VVDNSAYVSVFFSVTDQRGEPISGLGMQDFEINEDGDPVDPVATSLRIAPTGDLLVPTVLLLDASSRTTDTFTSVRDAAHRVIESAMPNQPIAVVTFAESYELVQDFTTDKALLDDAVDAASIVPFEQADLMSALDYTYGRWNDGDRLSAITNQSEITAGVLIVVTEGDDTANTFSLFEVLKGRSNKRTLLLTLADIDPDRAKLIGNMGVFAANEDRSNLAQVVDALLARLALLNQAVYRAEYCSTLRSLEVRLALSLPANMGVDANPVPEGRCAPVEENAKCTQDYLSCPSICCPISRPYYCDGSPGDCYGTLEEAMAVCGSECLACGLGSIGQYQTTAGPIIARYLQTSEFRDAQCDEFLGGGQGGAGGQGP
jgi:VWFA-related protein